MTAGGFSRFRLEFKTQDNHHSISVDIYSRKIATLTHTIFPSEVFFFCCIHYSFRFNLA